MLQDNDCIIHNYNSNLKVKNQTTGITLEYSSTIGGGFWAFEEKNMFFALEQPSLIKQVKCFYKRYS